MRKLAALVFLACVSTASCVFDSINGSGNIATEPRTVAGFSEVALSGSGELIIEQTGTESLTVTTDDNLLPHIRTEVRGNRLELGVRNPMTNLEPTRDIVYKLTVKSLERLDVSGSGHAEARGINQPRLDIGISGSGDVLGQGAVDDLDLGISGSGRYRGDQLTTRRADVHISGSGRAIIVAADTLNASVSGSGSIEYVGNPQVTENISASGSVRRR